MQHYTISNHTYNNENNTHKEIAITNVTINSIHTYSNSNYTHSSGTYTYTYTKAVAITHVTTTISQNYSNNMCNHSCNYNQGCSKQSGWSGFGRPTISQGKNKIPF